MNRPTCFRLLSQFAMATSGVLSSTQGMAQAPAVPKPVYEVAAFSMFGGGDTVARRDGDIVVVDTPATAADGPSPGRHAIRTWYDRAKRQRYQWDLSAGVPNCQASLDSGGDIYGDPFDGARAFDLASLTLHRAKDLGPAVVNGFGTRRYELVDGASRYSVWIEPDSGRPLKITGPWGDGKVRVLMEVKRLAKPQADQMVLPAECRRLQVPPATDVTDVTAAPSTNPGGVADELLLRDQMQIKALTGNPNPAAYRLAETEPGSSEVCSVQFSVVAAKTLQPLTEGVKVELGSGTKKVSLTEHLQGGVLRLAKVPEQFRLSLEVTQGNSSMSTERDVYRQCFGKPVARLLYVMTDDNSIPGGSAFLWVAPAGSYKPLPRAPLLAPAGSVHRVIAGDDELRQLPQVPGQPVRWQRLLPSSISTAEERSRTDDRVLLTDLVSGEALTLDMKSGLLILELGPMGRSKPITRASATIDGFNTSSVSTADAQISLTAPGRWQATGIYSGEWQETLRDGWSVHLRQAGSGNTLQLDLYKHLVLARAANVRTPASATPITDARASAAAP